MIRVLKRVLIFFGVSLIAALLVNCLALGTEIVCDLAMLGTSGKKPTNSIRALLFYLSRRILDPVAWIGGYGFKNLMLVSIAEAMVISLVIVVVSTSWKRRDQPTRALGR
ncbi:hypothetical protein VN12_07085 [Pirellula sp. SH-Sr6A]|nr:hypothetical protein VN12_07085 [Pirellula sp. SH-Sr6A]